MVDIESVTSTSCAISPEHWGRRRRAEELPLDANGFDLVFCVDVIHHVTNRAAFLSEAFRVLCGGGKLCVVTDSEDIILRNEGSFGAPPDLPGRFRSRARAPESRLSKQIRGLEAVCNWSGRAAARRGSTARGFE